MLIKCLAYLIKLALVVKNIDPILRDQMIHRFFLNVAEDRVQGWEWANFITAFKFIVTVLLSPFFLPPSLPSFLF